MVIGLGGRLAPALAELDIDLHQLAAFQRRQLRVEFVLGAVMRGVSDVPPLGAGGAGELQVLRKFLPQAVPLGDEPLMQQDQSVFSGHRFVFL